MSVAMTSHRIHERRTLEALGGTRVYAVKQMREDPIVTVAHAERNAKMYIGRAHRAVHKTYGPEVADESACGGYLDAYQHLILKEDGAMLESHFLSFLYKAAIYRAIKIIRPVQKRGGGHPPPLSLDAASGTEGGLADTLADVPHPWMDPDWRVILNRVEELEPTDRKIVVLRTKDWSFEEIAAVLRHSMNKNDNLYDTADKVKNRYYYIRGKIFAKDRGEE